MGEVTHEQANLMLRLYELRREPRLRQARSWFIENFNATTMEEMLQKYPPGSEENVNLRMVASYWEMCADIVNRGLIDDEFYFKSNGEAWVVWEKIRTIVAPMRDAYKNPMMFTELESLAQRFEAWRERIAPGTNEMMRKMFQQRLQAKSGQ